MISASIRCRFIGDPSRRGRCWEPSARHPASWTRSTGQAGSYGDGYISSSQLTNVIRRTCRSLGRRFDERSCIPVASRHRHQPHRGIVLTGTNLVYTKKYNLRIVHEVIRIFGPLSRADIARHTELSVQTISNLVRELLALGLVQEGARRSEGRGAPSTTLMLNPDGAYAI